MCASMGYGTTDVANLYFELVSMLEANEVLVYNLLRIPDVAIACALERVSL